MTDASDPSGIHSSTLIRYSEILRQQVLDSTTLEPLGRVDTLWMYPQVNRVLGIICKPSRFGPARLVVKLPQVQSVKTHVLVEGSAEETVNSKVEQLESLIGTSVWSDGGELVGRITDCLFDLKSGVIIRYLLVQDRQVPSMVARLTEGTYLLSPKQIKSFSRQRVLIEEHTVQNLRLYSEGLRLKLAQLSATLQQDYWQGATDEWGSFASHLQSVASQAKDTLLTLAEKAKATAQSLSQTVSQTMADQIDRFTEEESTEIPSSKSPDPAMDSPHEAAGKGPSADVIQTHGTDGSVFDIEDWQLGENSRPEHEQHENMDDSWDDSAPWDDWNEDPIDSPQNQDLGSTIVEDITSQDGEGDSPAPSSEQTTSKDDIDRVSDPNSDMEDPWIT